MTVLDVCCGSRMFYADKSDPRVIFGNIHQTPELLEQ